MFYIAMPQIDSLVLFVLPFTLNTDADGHVARVHVCTLIIWRGKAQPDVEELNEACIDSLIYSHRSAII